MTILRDNLGDDRRGRVGKYFWNIIFRVLLDCYFAFLTERSGVLGVFLFLLNQINDKSKLLLITLDKINFYLDSTLL